jgi:ATP-dependent RNA helicase DDX42
VFTLLYHHPVSLQVRELRRELDIHVSGFDPPRPIKTFGQAGFDHLLLGAIKKAGYEAPTAIQAQALPAALSGRDLLVSRPGPLVCLGL